MFKFAPVVMKHFFINIFRNYLAGAIFFTAFICQAFLLTSCFTGIESTKKINLSREDKKLSNPTAEEKFLHSLSPYPLKEWVSAKEFIVADNKALLVIKPQSGIISTPPDSVKGKILNFTGVEPSMNPAGDITVTLLFTDGIYNYAYDSGKSFDDAMENLQSNQIPMLIDVDMVNNAKNLLTGKTFWTKSPLWYDINGSRIAGKKFVPVEIVDVTAGDLVFPLKLEIKDTAGRIAYIYMNFGSDDNESRSFSNIFSLSDIKKHYPNIEPDVWELICAGEVKEGMTKDECKLSLGNPSDTNSGHDYSQTIDIWNFDDGKVLWFEDGRLVRMR